MSAEFCEKETIDKNFFLRQENSFINESSLREPGYCKLKCSWGCFGSLNKDVHDKIFIYDFCLQF